MLQTLAIKFISWHLRRREIDNIEIVIRSDGHTCYKRNKEREESIKETISKIKRQRIKSRDLMKKFKTGIQTILEILLLGTSCYRLYQGNMLAATFILAILIYLKVDWMSSKTL